jgi:hypothetical protein
MQQLQHGFLRRNNCTVQCYGVTACAVGIRLTAVLRPLFCNLYVTFDSLIDGYAGEFRVRRAC